MWLWDCHSQRPWLVIHIYVENYWGMLSQKVNVFSMDCFLFILSNDGGNFHLRFEPLYINWLWKINPLLEQFIAVKVRLQWCTYIQALFLVTAARLSSTLVQSSRERQQGSWPLLFTAVSAPKLTSGGTLRSTDMETNKCFYLRAPLTSGAPNSRTGWLWQSNGPASLFPHVPDGNFSTLTYKLHFPKSRFRLDPNADMRGRQKEIRARFESSANSFSFYDSSKWASLCCQKMVMWFIGLPWGTVMEQSNSDTDNRIC